MPVPFVRNGSSVTLAASGSITTPADTQPGDLVVIAGIYKVTAGTAVIATPTGYTALATGVAMTGATSNGSLFTKTAVAADAGASVTLTLGTAQQATVVLVTVGAANQTPLSWAYADQGVTASTAVPVPAASAGQDNALTLLLGGTRGSVNGTITFTAPAGFTMMQQNSATSGAAQDVGAFAAAGYVSTSQTVTASGSSWAITGQMVLAPATVSLSSCGVG